MKLEPVELTEDHKRRWMNTKTAFLWNAPGWSHILLTMLNPGNNDAVLYWTDNVEKLATDGRIVVANPKFFFELSLKQRVAALGKQVCHAVMMHIEQAFHLEQVGTINTGPGTSLPYVDSIAEVAQDFIANATLKEGGIGEIGVDWYYDANYTSDMSWVEVYTKIYKQAKGKASNLPMILPNKKKIDQRLPPGTSAGQSPAEAVQKREAQQQAWKNALAQAAAITRELGIGQGGGSQQQFFDKMLEPKVTWTDEVAAELSRMPGGGSYDWMKADDELLVRGIYAPARSGYGCNTVVVMMDSSGSIYAVPKLIDRFFGELSGILTDVKPKRIIVIWCDAEVQKTFEITDEMDLAACFHEGAHGGGGTDFRPPFEWLKQQEIDDIDYCLYLTDGDGSFPAEAPPFPMAWGDISGYKEKYPEWAHVIAIPNDGTA